MKSAFEQRLKGGHPNSLGNTIEIVEEVLEKPSEFDTFFRCWFSDDELVRLRVSNGVKRIYKEAPQLVVPYLDKLLHEIASIDQPSTQWTIAELFSWMKEEMTDEQTALATSIMKHNLEKHDDWIVLNHTMQILSDWAEDDPELKLWMKPHLERLSADSRKSVSKRAGKLLRSRY